MCTLGRAGHPHNVDGRASLNLEVRVPTIVARPALFAFRSGAADSAEWRSFLGRPEAARPC
jgi:hypothetical protein